MSTLGIREIYDAARSAGFSPQQAVTWTGIALAESGGRTDALNPRGEYSVGLWQINVGAGVRGNTWGDLTDPRVNARAAYEISNQGRDMRPWTTTHDHNKGTGADYRRYLDEVEREIGVQGDDRGVHGYGSTLPPPLPESDGADPPDEPVPSSRPDPGRVTVDSDRDGLTDSWEASRAAVVAGGAGQAYAIETGAPLVSQHLDRDGLADAYEQLSIPGAAQAELDRGPLDGVGDAAPTGWMGSTVATVGPADDLGGDLSSGGRYHGDAADLDMT